MALSLYIIPIDHLTNLNVPGYLRYMDRIGFTGLENVEWMWTTYTLGDIGIIVCDVDATQDAILSARPGVFPIPNLDDVVPNVNVRNKIRTTLEDSFVPGNWINTGMAYRAIMRVVGGRGFKIDELSALLRLLDNVTVSVEPARWFRIAAIIRFKPGESC